MKELALKIVALMRSHHRETRYGDELKELSTQSIHPMWDDIAARLYAGYLEAEEDIPRDKPQLRVLNGDT